MAKISQKKNASPAGDIETKPVIGAYDDEKAAAHAYDLAALKYWGQDTTLNFPLGTYKEEIVAMESLSKEEYIGSLRRHHHNGRWEARIGRVFGNKYLYLGTYATQEEAATAYDMAAIEYRGLNAVTNFDLSRYIKWLRPNQTDSNNSNGVQTNFDPDLSQDPDLTFVYNHQQPESPSSGETTTSVLPPPRASSGGTASSAVGLLWQSTKFKEMLERNSVAESPSPPMDSDLPRRNFPDHIQTYFDCHESNSYAEGEDNIFADLNSFASSANWMLEMNRAEE
ncbi:hypothetical protein L1987_51891 [Smallanthus sonchifolius]|uniref:Uncharacterized protein n=1 Tax=Smallanthus sonchifolius TaxID=185202 RepID=A0ACB9ERA1_9ASTR|nr:hypothetical protein L1987_51891 [Smallanthus sonchifolius]